MAKIKWTKPIPMQSGWYWTKYKVGRRVFKRPAQVVVIEKMKGADPKTWQGQDVAVVHVFGSGEFTSLTREYFGFGDLTFGPKIEEPK